MSAKISSNLRQNNTNSRVGSTKSKIKPRSSRESKPLPKSDNSKSNDMSRKDKKKGPTSVIPEDEKFVSHGPFLTQSLNSLTPSRVTGPPSSLFTPDPSSFYGHDISSTSEINQIPRWTGINHDSLLEPYKINYPTSKLEAAKNVVTKELAVLSRNPSERFKSILAKKLKQVTRNDPLPSSHLLSKMNESPASPPAALSPDIHDRSERLAPQQLFVPSESDIIREEDKALPNENNESWIHRDYAYDQENMLFGDEQQENSPPARIKHLKQSLALNQAARTPRRSPNKLVTRPSIEQNRAMKRDVVDSTTRTPFQRTPLAVSIKAQNQQSSNTQSHKIPDSASTTIKKPRKPEFVVPVSNSAPTVSRSGLRMAQRAKDVDLEKQRLLQDNDQRLKMALSKLMRESALSHMSRVQASIAKSSKKPSLYRTPQPSKTLKTKLPLSEPPKQSKSRLNPTMPSKPHMKRSKTELSTKLSSASIEENEQSLASDKLMEQLKLVLESKLEPFVLETHSKLESLAKKIEAVAQHESPRQSPGRISRENQSLNLSNESRSEQPGSTSGSEEVLINPVVIQNRDETTSLEINRLLDSPDLIPSMHSHLPVNGDIIELCPTPPPVPVLPHDHHSPSTASGQKSASPTVHHPIVAQASALEPEFVDKMEPLHDTKSEHPIFEKVDRDGGRSIDVNEPNTLDTIIIEHPSTRIPPRTVQFVSDRADEIPDSLVHSAVADQGRTTLWLPLTVQNSIKHGRDRRMNYLQEFLGSISSTTPNGLVIEGPWDAVQRVSQEISDELFQSVIDEVSAITNKYVDTLLQSELAV